ncbi:MAG: hypothetical protein K6E40_10360 [Desulfovibrio sp.]|nr:hypothetical protein [Desulfovibrio sp.]
MKVECDGLVALTGEDLAGSCADALALPRQPIVEACLSGFLAEPRRLGWCAAIFGLAGTGRRTALRQMAVSLPGSALVRAVSPEAHMRAVRPLNDALNDAGIEHCFYENATDIRDFISWSKFFADLHLGHAVLCGDTFSLYRASLDRLLCSVSWYPTEPVLHGVEDMGAWIESAIVGNLCRGARDTWSRGHGFGVSQLIRLEEEGRLADAIRAELYGRAGLDPDDAWAVRNVLLRIGVYATDGGWKIQGMRNEVWSHWPKQGRPRCAIPELQEYLERRRAEADGIGKED